MEMTVTLTKHRVGTVEDFPVEGGACVRVDGRQIAVFHFTSRQEWYACENACPHSGSMLLARGLIGDQKGEPKVTCPMHKKSFSLQSGHCLNDDEYTVRTYPVIVENGNVYIELA